MQTQPSNRQPEVGAIPAAARTAREESVKRPPTAGKHGRARLQPADKPRAFVCAGGKRGRKKKSSYLATISITAGAPKRSAGKK